MLDQALGDPAHAIARRSGVLRTRQVASRTTLLLLRLRHRLTERRADGAPDQLLEDAVLAAFTGAPSAPVWLDDDATTALLDAEPDANIAPGQATHLLQGLIAELPALDPALSALAQRHADAALAAHQRVRKAVGEPRGARPAARASIAPQLPVDILGAFLFLPVVGKSPATPALPRQKLRRAAREEPSPQRRGDRLRRRPQRGRAAPTGNPRPHRRRRGQPAGPRPGELPPAAR